MKVDNQIFSDEPLLDEYGLVEKAIYDKREKFIIDETFYRRGKIRYLIEGHDCHTEKLLAKSDTAEKTLSDLLSAREDIYY